MQSGGGGGRRELLRLGRRLHQAGATTSATTSVAGWSRATSRTADAGHAAVAVVAAVVRRQSQLTPTRRQGLRHAAYAHRGLAGDGGRGALGDEAVDYTGDLVALGLRLRRAHIDGAAAQIVHSLAPPHALHRTQLPCIETC